MFFEQSPRRTVGGAPFRAFCVASAALAFAAALSATSVIPISDGELYRRADVVVYGIVTSSDVTVDAIGRPESLSLIEPLSILKGSLQGSLVLHQLGGVLPDGRFFQMWGKPEYVPGREVIVFSIARPQGEYETAEMLLGKFEVSQDEAGNRFAVPDLAVGVHPGVDVHADPFEDESAAPPLHREGATRSSATLAEAVAVRRLDRFLSALRRGVFTESVVAVPVGRLTPVEHAEKKSSDAIPLWGNIGNSLWRWNNNATAAWTLNGTANIDGGGIAEATGALAGWTNDPHSNINYTVGSGTGNVIYLNAVSSALGCGWSTCLSGAGVIGCGGPSGGGPNSWRGDTYSTITGGTVELRSYCTYNEYSSTITESVIEHELGHTLGLGHSDQNVSVHDVCRGDEGAAIMRSVVQNYTALGTDDQDAIRWIYGDGLNWCTSLPPTISSVSPTFGSTAGGTVLTITGANFQGGASVTVGSAATGVTVVNSMTITATTASHAAGAVDVVVTNPDTQSATLPSGFTYSSGASFFTLTPCRVLDTRNPIGPLGGPALASNADRTFGVTGQCGIPATAKAISANVTITQPTSAGDLRIYAAGSGQPNTSVINYRVGQTRANNAVVPLGTGGALSVHCDQPSGTVQFIIDVNGYFQ